MTDAAPEPPAMDMPSVGMEPVVALAAPRCPLCDYDLRAITEPRCPECGYRFSWGELTDPTLAVHPFLFEHHLRDGWRRFWKTASAGLLPRRFWRQLFPTQPSRPRRLVWYWVLAVLPLLTAYAVAVLAVGIPMAQQSLADRAVRAAGGVLPGAPNPYNYPTEEAFLDAAAPLPPSLTFFRAVMLRGPTGLLVFTTLPWLLWPWLTFASLMIFQISMRRARVRTIHVLRCALYSADLVLWAPIAVVLIVATAAVTPLVAGGPPSDSLFAMLVAFLQFALFVLYTYRLATAYRTYLRFDHPIATAIVSQVIALLAVLHILRYLGRGA